MKKCLSNFDLKVIALVTMTIDHIGVIFGTIFYDIMRAVGRISFPIFAFLLTEGFIHTKSFTKYFLRILALAFISELIYDYFFFDTLYYPDANNIFFTLALGLITLYLFNKSKKLVAKFCDTRIESKLILSMMYVFIIVIMGAIASYLNFDYGVLGILIISFFYLFKDHYLLLVLSIGLATLLFDSPVQLFSLISLIFIYLYDKRLGKKCKWFFYFYYPVHILVLGLISLILA